MKVQLHPDAQEELSQAGLWYEQRCAGLGEDLLADVDRWLVVLRETPQSWPLWPQAPKLSPPVRRALMERFPFAIAYQVHADRVLVLAFAHTSRRPFYWGSRGSPESPPK